MKKLFVAAVIFVLSAVLVLSGLRMLSSGKKDTSDYAEAAVDIHSAEMVNALAGPSLKPEKNDAVNQKAEDGDNLDPDISSGEQPNTAVQNPDGIDEQKSSMRADAKPDTKTEAENGPTSGRQSKPTAGPAAGSKPKATAESASAAKSKGKTALKPTSKAKGTPKAADRPESEYAGDPTAKMEPTAAPAVLEAPEIQFPIAP